MNVIAAAHGDRISHNILYDDLIARCKPIYPGMKTFEAWAKSRGASVDRAKGWNSITTAELVTGKW